jgi:hypothetical protein
MLRLREAALDTRNQNPFEGHARVSPGNVVFETRSLVLQPGSFIVETDQHLGTLAVLLLEPESPDSFFQWGFLLEMLQRTEYAEGYVIEPMARRMLAEDPKLAAAFEAKLADDSDFAADANARLHWFYRQTPFFDDEAMLYPIGRSLD